MRIRKCLQDDIDRVVNSIYRLNASGAIGYLYTTNCNGTAISRGMFCDRESEKDKSEWTCFLDFATGEITKL